MTYLYKSIVGAILVATTTLTFAQDRVLVIGAGFAGLAAAKDLKEEGYEVVVLEARDRIGGRSFTDRSTGVNLDMGASWIHGDHQDPIADLAEQLGEPMSGPFDYLDGEVYDSDGTPGLITTDEQENHFYHLTTRKAHWYYNQGLNVSYQEMVQTMYEDGELDGIADNQREVNYLMDVWFELEYAGDVADTSAHASWEGDNFLGDDVVLPNGYDQLTNHLAQGLDIRLSQVVDYVEHDANGVTVKTKKNKTYTGDRVVVTVPLGVLKAGDIEFVPALPQDKLTAISRYGSGTLSKSWFVFPHAFWNTEDQIFDYVGTNTDGGFTEFYYFAGVGDGNVLLALNGGDFAVELEQKSNQQIINEAMETLRIIFGEGIPDPIDFKQSRWSTDPYAKGSYSYMGLNSTFADRDILRASIDDRVFFAGEATSSGTPATTEGAYNTGLQAAAGIKKIR